MKPKNELEVFQRQKQEIKALQQQNKEAQLASIFAGKQAKAKSRNFINNLGPAKTCPLNQSAQVMELAGKQILNESQASVEQDEGSIEHNLTVLTGYST